MAEAEGGGGLELPTGAGEGAGTTGRTGQWQVGDVMTAKVVAVPEQTSYKQIAQLLREHHLTALPVLSPEGRVAGMVSEADLLRKQERHARGARHPGWQLNPSTRAKTEARTVAGLMTSLAVTITPDAPLGTAARLMRAHRIRRLPVVDTNGKLVGVVKLAGLLANQEQIRAAVRLAEAIDGVVAVTSNLRPSGEPAASQ